MNLAAQQNTEYDIAYRLGMTPEGFRLRKKRDAELVGALERGRALGRMSLRSMQYESAKGGNWNAQKWLGQQYLDQSDKRDVNQSVTLTAREMTDEQLMEIIALGTGNGSNR
jgi:hypothetical protein